MNLIKNKLVFLSATMFFFLAFFALANVVYATSGSITCGPKTNDSIQINYQYFDVSDNVELFRGNDKIADLGQGTNSGSYVDKGLNANFVYIYNLAVGGLTIDTIKCTASATGGDTCNSPVATTYGADSITSKSALLNGDIETYGEYTQFWFEYGTSEQYLNNSTKKEKVYSGTSISQSISFLSKDTIYYFRAVAQGNCGTSYGQIFSFNTNRYDDVRGTLKCKDFTSDSIRVDYDFSEGNNVSLFRGNNLIKNWEASSESGVFEDTNLSSGSHKYYLRNGVHSGSPLIASVTCSTRYSSVADDSLTVRTWVRSVDKNTEWLDSITVAPGELIAFYIRVKSDGYMSNVIVRDILPSGLVYAGGLVIDDVVTTGDITQGINIGNVSNGQSRVVVFNARVAGEQSFGIGSTNIISTAFASGGSKSVNNTAKVFVTRGVVAGVATHIATGLTDNKLIDFVILPLLATLLIFTLFRKHISILVEWLERKREEVLDSRARRKLERIRKDLI
ncbi:MAG: hypothetical protein PHV25_00010 [Candidatus Pacebacteria bacterium]|nr:hypothetical protein [Candidatus Paceibacterota bacterium]